MARFHALQWKSLKVAQAYSTGSRGIQLGLSVNFRRIFLVVKVNEELLTCRDQMHFRKLEFQLGTQPE